MSDDGVEVEEGQEVVRRTIVGGRPRARHKRRIRVPIGLEKVLVRAAGDAAFREALLRDRRAAVDAAGYEMLPSELSVLASVPDEVLRAMIGRIDLRRHATRQFMRGVAAAAFASAAATTSLACDGAESQPAGIQPDAVENPGTVEVYDEQLVDRGVLADTSETWAPEVEVDEGSAADAGVMADTDEVAAPAEAEVIDYEDLPAPGGILPDEPESPPGQP